MNTSFFRSRAAVGFTSFIAVSRLQGCGGPIPEWALGTLQCYSAYANHP